MADALVSDISSLQIGPECSGEERHIPLLGDDQYCSHEIKKHTAPKLLPPGFSIVPVDSVSQSTYTAKLCALSAPPAATGVVCSGTLESLEKLTSGDAKTVYKASLMLVEGSVVDYQPGDSIGVCCANSPADVSWVLEHIDLGDLHDPDCPFVLQPVAGRSTPVPTWLLPDVPLSLRFRLTHCCELHVPVTKRMTRTLADCCVLPVDSDPYARRQSTRLLDLSSKEGQDLFDRCIRKPNVTFFDLLCSFPACKIPIVRLLELLPRLLPRPYTLLDSPQRTKDGHQLLSFVFTRVDFDPLLEEKELAGLKRYQYRLHGICTGFLERVWGDHTTHRCCFPVYLRRNLSKFQLPDDPSQPVIMIGAGTGLAPFMSFMRSQQYATSIARHPLWLIFGCRSPLTSLLFAEELGQFLTDKILSHCCLCFSRYNAACADPILPSCVSKRLADQACVHRNARYVQHCVDPTLTNHREQLTEWVLQRNAKIMVCGEAKCMAPAIMEAWVRLISAALSGGAKSSNGSASNLSDEDFGRGREYVKTMRSEKRYIEDIWS